MLFVCLSIFCENVFSQNAWQSYINKQTLDVQYIEHQSGAIEVKGRVDIDNVSAKDFLTLLSDTDKAADWIENISQVKLLRFLSKSENLVYTFIDSPWPVSNRDVITYSCYQKLNTTQSVLKVFAKPEYIAEKPTLIRIKTLQASWLLTQHLHYLTIEYQVYSLPEGSIALWLNNKVILKSVAKTLTNLRTMLAENKYKKTGQIIEAGKCTQFESNVKS